MSVTPAMLAGVAVLFSARVVVGRLHRVRVRGESMTPTLVPGDDVLVWKGNATPVGWVTVYRDRFDDRLRVKRVASVGPDRSLRVVGDNPVLSTESRDLGEVAPTQVVGTAILRRRSGAGWSVLRYHRRQ